LNKETISNPYKLIGLEGSEASRPWAAPAAASRIHLAVLDDIPEFPTVKELDNEFDGWPESGNPFVDREISTPAAPLESVKDNVLALSTTIRTKSTIVADLVRSEDKLFFISYAPERNQERKEWKLVQINFHKQSLQQYPNCLQDGRFLIEFFMEHHRDKHIDTCNRRYWLECHKTNSHKSLSVDYYIL
jgi:hypothetical protein